MKSVFDDCPLLVAPETPLITVLLWMNQGRAKAEISSSEALLDPGILCAKQSSCAIITDNKKPVGILTERDVVRLTAQGGTLANISVADVMTRSPITVTAHDTEDELRVWAIFRQYGVRHLPVVDDHGDILGVITYQSVQNMMHPAALLRLRQVSDVVSSQVAVAAPDSTILELAQLMLRSSDGCVVIVHGNEDASPNKTPVGIVTERDMVQFQICELDLKNTLASTVMSAPLSCVQAGMSLLDVTRLMQKMRVRRLVVTDERHHLVGLVTQASCLQMLNPLESSYCADVLQAQIKNLQDERVELLEQFNQTLASQVNDREKQFRLIVEQAAAGIATIDFQGNFLQANERWCEILGYSQLEMLTKNALEITHPDFHRDTLAGITQLIEGTRESFTYDKRCVRFDASTVWLHVTISRVTTSESGCLVVVAEDISERKRLELELKKHRHHLEELVAERTAELRREIDYRQAAEQALFQEKELAQVTLKSIADAVLTTDAVGRVTYLNPVAETLTGWSNQEAMDRPLGDILVILNETTRNAVESPVERVLRDGYMTEVVDHCLLVSRDGAEYGIDESAAPICDRNGHTLGVVMVFRDVTQERKTSQQLSWQANHDSLTGLVNRWRFEEILSSTLADRRGHIHVLCYLDLDRFKVVNDTCGHTAGDELLQQVAGLIKKQIRQIDTLARLGGDEFGLILYSCTLKDAVAIAENIRSAIQNFQFTWEDTTFHIGISIGLVVLDIEIPNVVMAMNASDAACYQAKDKGRNRVHIYQANDVNILQQRGQQQWSLRIKDALARDRFCLYVQTVASTQSNADVHHCELLLRMIGEDGELICPHQFIPAAERYDLIVAIDSWVVTHVLDHLAQSDFANDNTVYMINLSGASLGDETFLNLFIDTLTASALSPNSICIEITETAAVRNLTQVAEFMKQLQKLGISFALDDFGSGMSSFAYLKSLPIDYVKIDGKFITDMALDDTAMAIVESIHKVAQVMGLKTVAECVETPELMTLVQQIGIDFMQGYHIAEPVPLLPHA
ncbi:EAL domain-containing protein [Leptothoe kymatousa]|uniref:EAL domain-containing protein n=1 Tax=Leptothoe kymatousa TAU-MAC 1615 TaxID=2364775 RepID=A0ABS5Y2R8_9CYAN|nr:EAL domain-containing protein [Leptothoe kymatousa]MBT9312125.1 EAL domain-containing protein [Leptothoe kymatousa TAU-MAC 1615]